MSEDLDYQIKEKELIKEILFLQEYTHPVLEGENEYESIPDNR